MPSLVVIGKQITEKQRNIGIKMVAGCFLHMD